MTIKNVLPLIAQVNAALQNAYGNYKFDPKVGKAVLEILGHDYDGINPGKQFKPQYSLQFNIGVQRQLKPGTVLSVDYIYLHGIGGPLLLNDFERRHDAGTLNMAATQARVASVLGGQTIDNYLASHPAATIKTFITSGDTFFTGLTPNFQYMRFQGGGFSKYSALHVNLRGRLGQNRLLRQANYALSYSRGVSEATNGSNRTECLASPLDNHNPNNPNDFGPTGLDYRHMIGGGLIFRTRGGFELNSMWTLRTPTAQTFTVPNFATATSSYATIFSTDLNGDGGTGTGAARGDVLPGMGVGQFGRDVGSIDQLNQVITAFNQNYAGKLTPAGQALVTAGIFTQAQLVKLGAVTPTIPLVSTTNPTPWHNIFTTTCGSAAPSASRNAGESCRLRTS